MTMLDDTTLAARVLAVPRRLAALEAAEHGRLVYHRSERKWSDPPVTVIRRSGRNSDLAVTECANWCRSHGLILSPVVGRAPGTMPAAWPLALTRRGRDILALLREMTP